MGLIQRQIESVGIPTIGISIIRSFTETIKPPRTVFLDWPFGHPFGKPFDVAQQRSVLIAAFRALYSIRTPGEIIDLHFTWKGEEYSADKATPEGQSFDKVANPSVRFGQKKDKWDCIVTGSVS